MSIAPVLAPGPRPVSASRAVGRPIQVLIVDDSAVVRGLIARLLTEHPDIEIAGSVANGQMAVKIVSERTFDIVILDIEMPVMDGLTALPRILKADPQTRVIIASTLSTPGAAITMRALANGAADYIAKPTASRDITATRLVGQGFGVELVTKVRCLGEAGRRRREGLAGPPPGPHSMETTVATPARAQATFTLRPSRLIRPEVLVIGSSTGGPQALSTLIAALRPELALPILIAQHMPPKFTEILADHLGKVAGRPCAEGRDGELVEAGRIYVAPGNHHMLVAADGPRRVIRVNQDAPENFCRPAVDVLFRSAARCYRGGALAVVLTGIGADGTHGGRSIVEAAGLLIAQDEASSVVWGMPGSVARAGLCTAVLPLEELAAGINRMTARRSA